MRPANAQTHSQPLEGTTMKIILTAALGASLIAGGLALAAPAVAGPQDDVLCSSNMAYRTGHKAECKDIAINSHGGGGGWGAKDDDGDGVSNGDDNTPHDPSLP
ncbi:membrane protein [Mycobacterium phage Suigeneris]|uniref:Membrane protein n=2 Tax=Acadianvirus acadian TaxID=1982901 RepID=A0A7M1CPC6_9CAUD|nr:hypothetical protein CM14_gp91 [Mycobacterium phage Acadian]AER49004.1 hypothetical protein ACADIAN_91 [Mycobacterium phage Acadian]QOP65633.1 membrane protein [Mycobacterium phage Suigeneris]WUT94861.1 hypothetical protein PRODRIGUEZ_91 [Mycobacterium phage PRodriguez]